MAKALSTVLADRLQLPALFAPDPDAALYRNTLSWRLAFGLGSSDLDPNWEERKWLLRKQRSVHTRSVRA
jgi:hypothetical protein